MLHTVAGHVATLAIHACQPTCLMRAHTTVPDYCEVWAGAPGQKIGTPGSTAHLLLPFWLHRSVFQAVWTRCLSSSSNSCSISLSRRLELLGWKSASRSISNTTSHVHQLSASQIFLWSEFKIPLWLPLLRPSNLTPSPSGRGGLLPSLLENANGNGSKDRDAWAEWLLSLPKNLPLPPMAASLATVRERARLTIFRAS